MKSRFAGVALVVSALLLTGCTPQPEPNPDASSAPSASATPKPSATPTPDILAEPAAAFDLDCAAFAAEMEQITGTPAGAVVERVQTVSASGWTPGPAEFFAQRAMGMACNYTDGSATWEVVALPGAPALVAEMVAKGYTFPTENSSCSSDFCLVETVEGDVAISFQLSSLPLGDGAPERISELVQRTASQASSTQRGAEVVPSPIADADCTQFVTPEQLRELTGTSTQPQDTFGGWGYPAHAYHSVGGGKHCAFFDENGEGEYERDLPVMITTLPAGAWAFDQLEGRTPVEVEGADKAYTGTHPFGEYVDILVDADWVRITTSETVSAPMDVASTVATNLREIDWPGRVR